MYHLEKVIPTMYNFSIRYYHKRKEKLEEERRGIENISSWRDLAAQSIWQEPKGMYNIAIRHEFMIYKRIQNKRAKRNPGTLKYRKKQTMDRKH
jgi:hypothetical protein